MSVLPDADIVAEHFGLISHRGPTHSIVLTLIVFVPILVVYRKRAIPYLLALASHTLIGDFLLGGPFQLFWPVTAQDYGIGLGITSQLGQALEFTAFVVAIAMLIATRDLAGLMRPRKSNLILAVPTFTVVLPTFISYPMQVPTSLILPNVVYLATFTASMLTVMLEAVKRRRTKSAVHAL